MKKFILLVGMLLGVCSHRGSYSRKKRNRQEISQAIQAVEGQMGTISHLHRQGTTGDSRFRQAWHHLWYL